jgi:hypothetical protein
MGAMISAALTNAFAPGTTTMVLSALAIVMIAVPVYSLCREERLHRLAECVLTDTPHQCRRRAEFSRRDRLVRAFAAGKVKHCLTCDGLADARMPAGRRHHIHVDASGDENPAHALIPSELTMPRQRIPA